MNSKTESDTKTSNMMDSQETLQTEENVTENVAPEVNETENQTIEVPQTQEEVVARVKELAEADAPAEKQELDALKQAFYKIHKANVAAARAQFIENGGEPEAFLPTPNVLEDEFKAAMNVIKQKRAELQAELDRQKEENLQKKQEILERIKALSATPEEANQAYKEFKELQNQWKELTLVPAEKANELWKTYQLYVEQYYDQLKLNNEFREYDFKKNLEIKTRLCETAEKLNEEADVISAFQQLQALHQEFKETGPVAKELREEIWARFKAASTAVNKRHQQYFEELKQKEEENLAHKTALCEKIEAIDLTAIKTAAAWEAQTQQIIEMQKEWRTIGFAPQKMNVKIFERFRGACDRFFTEKAMGQSVIAEIQRSNLADTFQVVPSQINYVIKTRFTESRGYIVESKRGGGGYIRIVKVRFSDKHHMINDLLQNLADQLSEQVFTDLIQLLFDEKIITEREGNLILATASDDILGADAAAIRSRILRSLLLRLDRKGN